MPRSRSNAPPFDDLWARLLFSPILGVTIPNVARIVDHSAHSRAELVASYGWFTLVAFLVWEGNRRLYFRFRRLNSWFTNPWQRIVVLLGCVFLYTVPFCGLALWGWGVVTGEPDATWGAVGVAVLLTVGCTLFIVHVYETVFLLRDWESDRLAAEKLRRSAVEAELEALKREVNPHVLFNNLNALSHLVETKSPLATTFVQALAESYRYLLATRRRQLVTLDEEFALLDRYQTLTSTRYPKALIIEAHVTDAERSRWLLPPVTLPELLENAVKHNVLTPQEPLRLKIHIDDDCLIVANVLRPRGTPMPSTGVGLSNMADRFRLTVGRAATWRCEGKMFVVRLPLALSAAAAAGGDERRKVAR